MHILSIVLLSYRFYLTTTKDHLFLLCITIIVQFPVYHPQLLLHIRMTVRVTTPTTQINVDVDLYTL